LTIPSV